MTHTRQTSLPSRRGSSQPASAARSILQKRDKPYRTERAAVLTAKRKLVLDTSYTKPPPGYTFVQYGTPELSDRCRELSRQNGYPVYIVNAKPSGRFAADPDKVSHHVHRLGLHLKTETVEEACRELGYIMHGGQFVKETDLADQKQRSRMAAIMAKHGIALRNAQDEAREDAGRLRGSIREMFPKMPEEDMEAIIKHAWQEDSFRVGTNASLPLSRRIQLATIARIRHTYTDYDVLLRAFGDWHKARHDVEKPCLDKLKEWRGENAQDDTEESEWIMRDFIVIDDDDHAVGDDSANLGHEADDEDSAADQGYASDISLEITQHRAIDDDLSAESSNEAPYRVSARNRPLTQQSYALQSQRPSSFHLRTPSAPSPLAQPASYRQPYSHVDLSQRIAQQQPPQQPPQHMPQPIPLYSYGPRNHQYQTATYESPRVPVTYQPWPANYPTEPMQYAAPAPAPTPPRSGGYRDQIIVDGKVYERLPPPHVPPEHIQPYPPDRPLQYHRYEPYEQAVQSIEHPGPELEQSREGWFRSGAAHIRQPRTPPLGGPRAGVIDLTTPERGPIHVDLVTPERPRRVPLQPVHGAPAPVQQVPRRDYYVR